MSSQHRHASAAPAAASSSSAVAVAASSTAARAGGHAASSTASQATGHGGGGGRSSSHPEYVWYGILALLALATIANACYLSWVTYRRYRARRGASASSKATSADGAGGVSLRRVPQAVLSASRIFGFRWRIPGLELMIVEALFTVAYVGACLVWCFAPVDGVAYPTNLTGRSWGTRTGMMATIQLPFIVLLAMKNNAITWLTGIGHEKLNLMHRVVSRCILILTWLHFGGIPAKLINEGYKIAGLVGAIAQTITTLISVKWFRRRFYETFYVSHVVLILIFLVSIHVHVVPVRCDKYIWGVWAIWLFDRLFRGARYILLNLVLRPARSVARIETIGADGLRITLRRRVPGGWTAGQHVFLAFPSLGLQSHPFTIGNMCDPQGGDGNGRAEAEMVFIVRAMRGQTRLLMDRAEPTGCCEIPAMIDGPYGHPEDIRPFSTCVFIAGGTGVTYTIARMHQLFRDLNASDACAQRVVFVWAIRTQTEYEWIAADLEKIITEAPPSLSLAVDIYLTGGSGSLGALPTLDFGPDIEKGPLSPASDSSSSKSKTASSSESGCETPITPSTPDTPISYGACTLKKPDAAYFTSGSSTPTTECLPADGAFPLAQGPGALRKRCGRPDVYRILEEEVAAARGAVAVDVSGPDRLVADVRNALCAPFAGPVAALRGAPTVMLSVEQFRM
ncbi:hypothetical protein OH76DRAFT_1524558 [Lentinus brumalis]|uniref:ferric-chelate reductase (NADPH) n=1 Tax=Lentinus brumalis TaxID=2498619 RepID=A0A371DSE7_9APHY|nr:hypothetical protein OH76DRAFT_1524558 [Polyporus brumalis]